MSRALTILLCATGLGLFPAPASPARDTGQDTARGSDEVEESDEEYRRRMELEDARQRNLGYTLPPESYAARQDLLEQLPEASRDNIRDQLVDIVVANGEWEPADALRDYPYAPTAAALEDPDLLEREQAAWDEQVEKYHKREAAAFGTYLGSAPGSASPANAGAASGTQPGGGVDGAGSQPGDGSGKAEAEPGDGSPGSAGTYVPQSASSGEPGEEVSTAGARQSALEFLRGEQGRGEPQAEPAGSAAPEASAQMARHAAAESASGRSDAPDPATDTAPDGEAADIDLSTPGIIAIEDLENLEGAESADNAEGADPPR